jgi:hypothetical protein
MSGPSLPDTDDPWVLLEVDRDAAPEVVRRAYLAKIKVHKPDRAPEAFRRIREAYEAIAAGLPRAPAPRHATPASSIAPDEPATHAAHGADATAEPDAAPRPSPYLDTDALDALLADRRTDELFVALQAGRIDPRHVMAVVHVLATLSVLVDGAAFDRLVAAFPAEVRELAGRDSVFALRLAAGPAIARWVSEGEAPCPALLAVLVELPIADDTRCRALTRDLANSVRGDPSRRSIASPPRASRDRPSSPRSSRRSPAAYPTRSATGGCSSSTPRGSPIASTANAAATVASVQRGSRPRSAPSRS